MIAILSEFVIRNGRGSGIFVPDADAVTELEAKHIHGVLSTIISEFRMLCNDLSVQAKNEGKKGLNLEVGYFISKRPSAFAANYRGVDLIGISLGMIFLLRNTFRIMIAQGTVYSMMYDGMYPLRSSTDLTPGDFDIESEIRGVSSVEISADNPHEDLGDLLLKIAVTWILGHELAHLWNGHVEESREFSEVMSMEDDGSDCILSNYPWLALEVDADIMATRTILMVYFGMQWASGGIVRFPRIQADGSPALVLRNVFALRIALLTTMFCGPPDRDLVTDGKHPNKSARMRIMLDYLKDAFKFSNAPFSEVERMINLSEQAALFGLLRAYKMEFPRVLNAYAGPGETDFREVMRAWNSALPALQSRMRGALLRRPYTEEEIKKGILIPPGIVARPI